MYDERRDKFSFKNFFLTLLLVLLFIFLMLWLFPTKSYVNNKLSNNSNGNSSSKSNEKYDLERLEVLYDEIFANNVYRMKEAAISYFTNERMPQIVGQSKKLTLQEMYDLHLVLKMKDKDGKACDVKKSFVEMTKYTEEYRLKVNLSCGDTEDYIIVYLGCYNYCSSGLCEKKTSTPSKKTAYEENRLTPIVVEPKKNDPENPTPAKHKCKVVDGKYYDAKGNIVSKEEYKKSCEVPTPTKHKCEVVDGKYYDAKGNIVSKEEYKKSCEVPTPIKNYLYEYKLIVEDKTTCPVDWSSWSKNKVSATNLVKVETKDEKQIKEYKEVSVPVTVTEKVKKQVSEKYISKYITEVVKTGTKDVKVGTTTKTTYEKVKVGTVEYATGEIGIGTKVPADTEHVKYKILSTDTTKSCSYCTNETRYTWEIYTVEPVYDVVEKKEEVPVYETINVYETRKTPVYDIRTVEKEEEVTKTVYETKKVPVYENVTYYRYKECKFEKGYTDVVWTKNKIDSNLILRGYKFTGNVKQA